MTNSLLTTTDFARFQAKDPGWFLDATAQTITDHCGWHIAPSTPVTEVDAKVGNHGIIMLPSLYVTSIEELRIAETVVDPSAYTLYRNGWIVLRQVGAYYSRRKCPVSVDFTHGFDETPATVAEVGYELAATALEKASGVVTEMQRGPTSLTFKEFGIVLSDDQKDRLGPYTIVRV